MQPDIKIIQSFAETILDRDDIHLHAIDPAKPGSPLKNKIAHTVEELCEWVAQMNVDHNIYYAYNFPSPKRAKKAHRKDIKWISGYHVDVDTKLPPGKEKGKWLEDKADELDGLCDVPPVIVMTGNGLQAMWEFDEPLQATKDNVADVELINRQISFAVGGDATHNVDRIMRLPGTVNWPDKKKEARGCVPTLATVVQNGDIGATPEDFRHLPELPTEKLTSGGKRTDYTTHGYSDTWRPVTFTELEAERPSITDIKEETDNSLAACDFIRECIFFFVNKLEIDAKHFPHDVAINIANLIWESEYPFLDHYARNGRDKAGYDIDRSLDWAHDKIECSPQTKNRQKASALAAVLREKEPEEHNEDELRHLIREHLRQSCKQEDLPDLKCGAKGYPATSQITSEDNLRYVVTQTGLKLSWDIMDACVVYGFEDEVIDGYLQRFRADHTREQRSGAIEGIITSFTQSIGLEANQRTEAFLAREAYNDLVHPFEEYCTSEPWDGKDRIKQLTDCVHSDHEMKDKFIKSMVYSVAATMKSLHTYRTTGDGEQISGAVIFVGDQGIGKSTFMEKLLPAQFRAKGTSLRLGGFSDADNKKQVLGGVFCVLNEIGQSLNRSESEALKDFMTTTVDSYRPPFSPITLRNPRTTAFFGTSNDLALKDQTGSRRFMPMKVTGFNWRVYDSIDRQQLFAQAYHDVVVMGEPWWLEKEDEKRLQEINDEYRDISLEEGRTIDYLSKVDDSYEYEWLTMTQIFKVLKVDYHPRRQGNVVKVLDRENVEFAGTKTVKTASGRKRALRKVRRFPIRPDDRILL